MQKSIVCVLSLYLISCATPPVPPNGGRTPSGFPDPTMISTKEVPTEVTMKSTIDQGVANLMAEQIRDKEGAYWRYPTRLGLHFSSQYFLMLKWLGRTDSRLDPTVLETKLVAEQLPDGSWYQVKDGTHVRGNLDSSVFNYWALKVLAARPGAHDPAIPAKLQLARQYILSNGGLEKTAAFTKVLLALHGNVDWEEIPYIPLTLNKSEIARDLILKDFAQWVIPHLKPMSYMRFHEIVRQVGPEYAIPELFVKAPKKRIVKPKDINAKPSTIDRRLARFIVEDVLLPEQLPRGSWGGYSLATLFSVVSLDHYARFAKKHLLERTATFDRRMEQIEVAKRRGVEFIEELYFNSGDSSYYGVLNDSTYWNSGLAIWALAENGIQTPAVIDAANFLVKQQQTNGGVPFGYDFWKYPDIDDTFVVVMGIKSLKGFERSRDLGLKFVLDRGNRDGGWGTFDVENNVNPLINLAAGSVSDSADLFDESEPDVTGHSLELIGRLQGKNADRKTIERTYKYLAKTRNPHVPTWHSRWEMNYLFGTFSVVGGLTSVGYDMRDPLVSGAVNWLKTVQNDDGGYGESALSYTDVRWAGRGISTPSQTAWALATFVDAGEINAPQAQRAANYLIQQLARDGKWMDKSAVGTGHPGILYMEYPSYPMTFPLIALGKYAAEMCKRGDYRGELCTRFR